MVSKRIRFVTDSTCDLPAEIVQQWKIGVVPAYVNIGDESYADDGVQLDREDYYNRLPTLQPFPTTAAPSPGTARQIIEATFEDADHVVIITAPAKLSAIYDSLRLGASNLPQDQVTLIDGGSVTMALGYQVQVGAEVAAETGDLDLVLKTIGRVREAAQMRAMITSLDNLRRSGRINMVAAGLGTLLQVKPVITVKDGAVEVLARVRTTKRAQQELVNMIREQAPLDRLTLLHANNPDGVGWMREQIGDITPEDTYEVNVSPALGTHVGSRCLGFVTLNQNWRL